MPVSRVYPRPALWRRSAVVVLGLALLVAGCGGGGKTQAEEDGRKVPGPGFTFTVPKSWTITLASRAAVVRRDENTLVSVTVLPLHRRYTPDLFPKVVPELDGVAAKLAAKLHGRVAARETVVVDGGRARQYDIAYERDGTKLVDRVGFVLRGKSEYQLLCRWEALEGVSPACGQLVRTFRIG